MSREHLSAREKAPGDDTAGRDAEGYFLKGAELAFPTYFIIEDHPRDLDDIYGEYGVVPEAKITNPRTGRFLFIEVKRQGMSGNAEERAYKHYAPGFIRLLKERYDLPYHPFATIFCEDLAWDPRYTDKIQSSLDYPHYLFWEDYAEDLMAEWVDHVREAWLG
jgi:hypothetical protein